MKKHPVTRILYYFLQFTWGILQNIAGFFVFAFLMILNPKRKVELFHGAVITEMDSVGSMGLGMFIFFAHGGRRDENNAKSHEFGHTVQSVILGPLFLLVIALPSVLWAGIPALRTYRKINHVRYVDFYPEKWANHLGQKITGIPGLDN